MVFLFYKLYIYFTLKQKLTYFITFPSISVIVLICLTILQIHLNQSRWNSKTVLTWDVLGYYSYLPAVFIDKDVRLSFINESNTKQYNGVKYVSIRNSNGFNVMKFPIGMAILYSPFFLAAHLLAKPLGYDQNGYSEIYHCFIEFSGLFYLLFGLLFLRKTLLFFYSEKITALSLFFIFFGTNLLCYSAIDSAMSHAFTFSIFSVFIYYTITFLKSPNIKYTIYLGILFVLIVLIRPINVLLIIIIFLIGITSFEDFKNRLRLMINHYKLVMLFIAIAGLITLPQLVYWKYVTGNFFYFSYGKEHFYFNNPHIFEILLGFRKGWFIYTPLIVFALLGVWFMRKQQTSMFFYFIIILLPLYIYIISCWWCWWYGGSYSQRTLIDLYPLLCIGFATLFYKISMTSIFKKRMIYGTMTLLLLLNLFQTAQYKYNIIHYDSMTFKAYLHVFGSLDSDRIDESLLNHPDYERAVVGLND